MPQITPAWASFFKTLIIVVALAVLGFFANAANLEGVLPTVIIPVIVSLAAALEAKIKAENGKALFGAVRVR